jgi:hypothetical protein
MASVAFYTLIKTGYEVALYHSRQSITQSPTFVFILHQCTSAGPWTAFHLVYMRIEGSSLSSPSILHFQTLPKPEEERQICTEAHHRLQTSKLKVGSIWIVTLIIFPSLASNTQN